MLLDQVLGRRAIIFISALFGIGGSLWQALAQSFGSLLVDRLFLGLDRSTSWRLMAGSSFVPPLFVVVLILFAPESPRYLLTKRRAKKALEALLSLRGNELSAGLLVLVRRLFVYQ